MIDADERLFEHKGDGFGSGQADNQPANQAGPGRCRNPVELGKGQIRVNQGLGNHEIENFHVSAGRNLRHHATIGCVSQAL